MITSYIYSVRLINIREKENIGKHVNEGNQEKVRLILDMQLRRS